jgi:hypothetical protein
MSRKPVPKADDPAQYKRFLEAARKAEADETEDGADSAFRKVVTSPPSRPSPASKASRGKRLTAK